MKTSTTKLIATLAVSAGLLTTNAAFAKGGSGKSSGGGNHHSMSSGSNKGSSFKPFKMSSNNSHSMSHSNSMSGSSKKNLNFSQNFKKQDFHKQDFHKDHKNSGLGISFNSMKNNKYFDNKFDKNSKDYFFKKDYSKKNFWWDSSYSKNYCYPYNFGGYYPTYNCYSPSYCYTPTTYDYCTPTYTTPTYTTNYNSGSITVLENVEPLRTRVAVGSTLMVGGQAFGDQAGGARLRISGMALPIEVLEWTPAGVKVRLPQVEITGVTPAEIEVVRGDGSLASKVAVELTASAEQLALGR